MITDQAFSEAVETAVASIEQHTDAEVVVVVAPRSGSYQDLVHVGAAAGAILGLAVLLFNPWVHTPPAIALADVALCYIAGLLVLRHPRVLHLLAGRERMDRQVSRAAAAEFHLEAVHATPQRTGLLVYVSAMEGRVEIIGDVGLEARVPRGRWASATREFGHDDLQHFLAGLKSVGETLADAVPRTEGHRVDLANAPRIRE